MTTNTPWPAPSMSGSGWAGMGFGTSMLVSRREGMPPKQSFGQLAQRQSSSRSWHARMERLLVRLKIQVYLAAHRQIFNLDFPIKTPVARTPLNAFHQVIAVTAGRTARAISHHDFPSCLRWHKNEIQTPTNSLLEYLAWINFATDVHGLLQPPRWLSSVADNAVLTEGGKRDDKRGHREGEGGLPGSSIFFRPFHACRATPNGQSDQP